VARSPVRGETSGSIVWLGARRLQVGSLWMLLRVGRDAHRV